MHASGRKHIICWITTFVRNNENARHEAGHNVVFIDSERLHYAWLATVLPSAACAAARRAIGTR
jgi:hypothetical protein